MESIGSATAVTRKGLRSASGRSRKVRIDQRVIDREIERQRRAGDRGRRYLVDSDCPGLRLVLYRSVGKNEVRAAWTYSYRPRGADSNGRRLPQRTMRLGDLTTLTPADARREAEAAKAAVRNGRDPAAEAQERAVLERLEKSRRTTMDVAMKQYVAEGIGGGTVNKDFEERNLRLAIKEMETGTMALADLTRADILRLVGRHRDKPAVAYARFGALSRCLDWHAERDDRLVNPCRLIGRKFRPKRPAPRQRVYTAAEVKALWDATGTMSDAYADFLRLMILAPLRRMECSELTPANLDKGRRALALSQGTTKNGDAFVLPLPAAAWEIVQRRASLLEPSDRLFPFNSTGGAMNAWPYLSRLVKKASGVGRFMFHDLRRTFMTELAEAGAASLDTLDGCLNHRQSATRSGVRMAYLHATMLSAKTAAMTRWGEIVAHVVEHGRWPREDATGAGSTNVVPLRSVAA